MPRLCAANIRASLSTICASRFAIILTGEKVNKQFFAWLDDQRKNNKIEFREESLA